MTIGSEHNECVCLRNVQGGISNGEIVHFKVAFKPTPSIGVRRCDNICFLLQMVVVASLPCNICVRSRLPATPSHFLPGETEHCVKGASER